jgi:hypothetical protein
MFAVFAFLVMAGISTGSALADTGAAATPMATPEAAAAAAPASLQGFMNYADFTWVNGNTHEVDYPMDGKYFSPEVLVDTNYAYDFARPIDHTIGGSTCTNLANEFALEDFGVGGDWHIPVGNGGDFVRGRLMTEFGMYSTEVPRDDESPALGSWNVITGVQYLSEAYCGYHFAIPGTDGLNIDAGQMPSYVGLYSFYDSENWTYQASYVSSNTPWFFTGCRIQFFPSDALKIEPWLINGWQTYNEFNTTGFAGTNLDYGLEMRWAPSPDVVVISNNYAGADNPDSPNCYKFHTDDSLVVKYMDDPKSSGISKMAFSLTCDAGFQAGPLYLGTSSTGDEAIIYANGGASVTTGPASPTGGNWVGAGDSGNGPTGTGQYANSQGYYDVNASTENFLGFMLYDRTWFAHNTLAFTVGGGAIQNTGAYLALLPPIDGDTAATYGGDLTATEAFGEYPGEQWTAWDCDASIQIMPNEYWTFDLEYTHRSSSLNYFVGPGGITSSDGWRGGAATGSNQTVANGGTYQPNLVKYDDILVAAMMIHI